LTNQSLGARRARGDWLNLLIVVLMATHLACAPSPIQPMVADVSPGQSYTDVPVFLQVQATRMRPALHIDINSGELAPDLRSLSAILSAHATDDETAIPTVDWDGGSFFWFKVPSGLPADTYGLRVAGPRGESAAIPEAFTSLGADPLPPTLSVPELQDDGIIGAGIRIDAEITADDDLGQIDHIEWSTSADDAGVCPADHPTGSPLGSPVGSAPASTDTIRRRAPARLHCRALFVAPLIDDDRIDTISFSFYATAWDVAGHKTDLSIPLQVARPPTIETFSEKVGALAGGQPFVVKGAHFIPGSYVVIDRFQIIGMATGGDLVDDHTIRGETPPHDRAEHVNVKVVTPAGTAVAPILFEYIAPPRPRDIQPPIGPTDGGTRVTVRGNDLRAEAVIYVGATRETRLPLGQMSHDAPDRVVGFMPPGRGTVTVWAVDPITGEGDLPMAFTYQDPGVGAKVLPDLNHQ
jgi:hypothetical protein